MPPKTLRYVKDEKVLCKHGPCVYPAKILEVDAEKCLYKVHYDGWNRKWDENVEEDRLSKFSDESAKAAAAQNKILLDNMKKRKSTTLPTKGGKPDSSDTEHSSKEKAVAPNREGSTTGSRSSTPSLEGAVSRSKKRPAPEHDTPSPAGPAEKKRKKLKDDAGDGVASLSASPATSVSSVAPPPPPPPGPAPNVESEIEYQNKREIRIKLPDELRPLLVDDWDLVTKQMKLVRIPATLTVAQILDDYISEKRNFKNMTLQKISQILEMVQGIRSYFNVMLGTQLLYKFERPQLTDVLQKHSGKSASEVYGFIHLLRMFVKLGQMLSYTPLDEKSVYLILSHLADFLKYMKKIKPKDKDLSNEYETASPEYQRLAYC